MNPDAGIDCESRDGAGVVPALYRIRDVVRITALTRATLYRRIAAGLFLPPCILADESVPGHGLRSKPGSPIPRTITRRRRSGQPRTALVAVLRSTLRPDQARRIPCYAAARRSDDSVRSC